LLKKVYRSGVSWLIAGTITPDVTAFPGLLQRPFHKVLHAGDEFHFFLQGTTGVPL
jgi:hypothetical protein